MSRVTIDAALAAELSRLGGPFELCDPEGRVVARAMPHPHIPGRELVGRIPTDDELAALFKAGGKTYSIEELLASLETK